MIKRDYFICGAAVQVDGSKRRPIWMHMTRRSWRPQTIKVFEGFRKEADLREGEVLEMYSWSRLPRWF